jgi:toxin ParE1/3/4
VVSRVRHSRQAQADLLDIWLTIAADSVGAADSLLERIEVRVNVLEDFPESGPARRDIAESARMLVEPPYLIFYDVTDGEARIVRVLHGHRDIDQAMYDSGVEP